MKLTRNRVKASAIPVVMAPWRYEATFSRWIGSRARAFREFAADLVEARPGESVLDLGSGTGALAMVLHGWVGEGGQVAGIDLSKGLVAGARRRAKRAGISIDFRVGSVEELPFGDGSMDLVVSSLVMHHLAPDVLRRAVGEIGRVVKPGGRVVILDFQSLDQAGRNLHSAPTHRHVHHGGHGHGHHPKHRGDLHDHQDTLVELLKAAGFTDASSTNVEFGQRLEVIRGRLA